jgi:tRNA threonylcarbamoyladenosine biosynthesis protein TsaB
MRFGLEKQMKIHGKLLGLDSSAVSASCAVVERGERGKILAYAGVNMKITHSQTLMPLVENTLRAAGLTLQDIDGFAVSNGPGSFTGLRIAVSAVKGMAFALNKPVCGVSTLAALARNLVGQDVIACPVMDARRGEVYNALFDICGDEITRLTPDRAITLSALEEQLAQLKKRVVFTGDGAELPQGYSVAPELIRRQNAACVCFASDEFVSARELMPVYIRIPQAERERKT